MNHGFSPFVFSFRVCFLSFVHPGSMQFGGSQASQLLDLNDLTAYVNEQHLMCVNELVSPFLFSLAIAAKARIGISLAVAVCFFF
jgi:hypothetical protein